jgi:hypothetical protein
MMATAAVAGMGQVAHFREAGAQTTAVYANFVSKPRQDYGNTEGKP